MYSPEDLSRIFEELAQEVKERRFPPFSNSNLIVTCSEAWCRKLGLDETMTHDIINWIQHQNITTLGELFKWITQLQQLPSFLIGQTPENIENRSNATRVALFIALTLVGVGIALFSLQKKEKYERAIPKNHSVKSLSPIDNKYVLILVINAQKQEVLKIIRASQQLTSEISQRLYDVTQELWLGTEEEFDNNSKLNNYFSINRSEYNFGKSEYDCYFVKINLKRYRSGFRKDASQLERLDAFRELPKMIITLSVSNRLPSNAYANSDFYSR